MRQRVTTCLWGNAWERYGEKFVAGFVRFWPADVELVIFTDRHDLKPARGEVRQLGCIPGFNDFRARWKSDALANGRQQTDNWKTKEIAERYSWRHDAVRWMPQGVTPAAAMIDLDAGDVCVWFDGDVMTHKAPPPGWLDSLMGPADVAHLGRAPKHSEIGFMGFRSPNGRLVADAMSDFYLGDLWRTLPQWHSAYVFDHCVERARAVGVKVEDMTPGGSGHVWFKSPLRHYTDHLKGRRKDIGVSPERRRA